MENQDLTLKLLKASNAFNIRQKIKKQWFVWMYHNLECPLDPMISIENEVSIESIFQTFSSRNMYFSHFSVIRWCFMEYEYFMYWFLMVRLNWYNLLFVICIRMDWRLENGDLTWMHLQIFCYRSLCCEWCIDNNADGICKTISIL